MRLAGVKSQCHPRQAVTLIELVLVMGLLAIVVAMSAPLLSRFFRGRSLEWEAERFVALTRYCQNQATSTGEPMEVWIQPDDGTYGMRKIMQVQQLNIPIVKSNAFVNPMEVTFRLGDEVRFELSKTNFTRNSWASIRFWPDTGIDETSVRELSLMSKEGDSRWISQSRNRLYYEIRQLTNSWYELDNEVIR